MKKNYEKNQLLLSSTFLFIIIVIILVISLYVISYKEYKIISATVITSNYTSLYVDNDLLKCLQKNHKLYIKNKAYEYEITDITKKVVKNKSKWHHEVIIRLKKLQNYKDKDIITISIYCKRKVIATIFENCWKE